MHTRILAFPRRSMGGAGAVWNCCCCCSLESYLWVVVVLETVCATLRP